MVITWKKVLDPFWITIYDPFWIMKFLYSAQTGCLVTFRLFMTHELIEEITMPLNENVHNKLDRRSFIGGSDARIIMGNDEASLVRLWREKRREVEPEDLSDNLIVQLGTVTEGLNRRWYERNTGQSIKDVQKLIQHPVIKWMAATLDGLVEPSGA